MAVDPVSLIKEEEIVELTQQMVRIPSQYIDGELAQHAELAEFMANYMRSIGLEVAMPEAVEGYPTVVGTTPGGEDGPTIGVIGHYSTVAIGEPDLWTRDPLGAELEGDRIYGRGSCDQKGGMAAAMIAVKSLMESGLPRHGRIRLLMVPGEGCTEMALEPVVADPELREQVKCDLYLDSDGGPGRISLVHGGWIWLELLTKGKGGHAGALCADGSFPINPVDKMIDVLYNLKAKPWMTGEKHPLFNPDYGRHSDEPIMDINVFRAGDKVNIIPNQARAQIDIRMLPAQSIDGVLAELEQALESLRAEDPELDVSYRIVNRSKNDQEVTPDHPVIQAIMETCRELGEPEPELVGSIGGGRASLASMGPVLHFGAGGGKGAHAPDEYAEIPRLVKGARLHAKLYGKLMSK